MNFICSHKNKKNRMRKIDSAMLVQSANCWKGRALDVVDEDDDDKIMEERTMGKPWDEFGGGSIVDGFTRSNHHDDLSGLFGHSSDTIPMIPEIVAKNVKAKGSSSARLDLIPVPNKEKDAIYDPKDDSSTSSGGGYVERPRDMERPTIRINSWEDVRLGASTPEVVTALVTTADPQPQVAQAVVSSNVLIEEDQQVVLLNVSSDRNNHTEYDEDALPLEP